MYMLSFLPGVYDLLQAMLKGIINVIVVIIMAIHIIMIYHSNYYNS